MEELIEVYYDCKGNEIFFDLDGNLVEKTKEEYPFNYDTYVIWKSKDYKIEKLKCKTAYSDRLLQWDYNKFNNCYREVWNNESHDFSNRQPKDVKKFLSLYFNCDINIMAIMEAYNIYNGCPYWIFIFEKLYPLYYMPTRVINEYKERIGRGDMLTTPIIKRRVSAMIYATMDDRKKINDNLFKHRYGKVEIFVESDTKVVSKINYVLPITIKDRVGGKYGKLCKYYGLNNSRKDFKKFENIINNYENIT